MSAERSFHIQCVSACPFLPAAYNDYQLHTFCMTYHGLLGQYMLPPTCLMASGKLVALDALLKELKAAGSRPLIFSQVRQRQKWFWGLAMACCCYCIHATHACNIWLFFKVFDVAACVGRMQFCLIEPTAGMLSNSDMLLASWLVPAHSSAFGSAAGVALRGVHGYHTEVVLDCQLSVPVFSGRLCWTSWSGSSMSVASPTCAWTAAQLWLTA